MRVDLYEFEGKSCAWIVFVEEVDVLFQVLVFNLAGLAHQWFLGRITLHHPAQFAVISLVDRRLDQRNIRLIDRAFLADHSLLIPAIVEQAFADIMDADALNPRNYLGKVILYFHFNCFDTVSAAALEQTARVAISIRRAKDHYIAFYCLYWYL